MVYFQVEDVFQKFKGLEKIEENGWTLRAPTPKKKRAKVRTQHYNNDGHLTSVIRVPHLRRLSYLTSTETSGRSKEV